MKYLLDTSVVSEPLRADPAPGVLRRLRRHEGEAGIASIVWHELQFGCARLPASRRRTAIEEYLEQVVLPCFPVLDYDQSAADWHARERARLEKSGTPRPFVDGQIAAIAAVHDLVLVTADKSGFRGFKGLDVRKW